MKCVINIHRYLYAPKKRDRTIPWDGTGEILTTRTVQCGLSRGEEIMNEMAEEAMTANGCAVRAILNVDGRWVTSTDLYPARDRAPPDRDRTEERIASLLRPLSVAERKTIVARALKPRDRDMTEERIASLLRPYTAAERKSIVGEALRQVQEVEALIRRNMRRNLSQNDDGQDDE